MQIVCIGIFIYIYLCSISATEKSKRLSCVVYKMVSGRLCEKNFRLDIMTNDESCTDVLLCDAIRFVLCYFASLIISDVPPRHD
jgi:hypothetical protein